MKNRRRFHGQRNKGRGPGGGQGGGQGTNHQQQGLPMDVEDYLAEEEAQAQALLPSADDPHDDPET